MLLVASPSFVVPTYWFTCWGHAVNQRHLPIYQAAADAIKKKYPYNPVMPKALQEYLSVSCCYITVDYPGAITNSNAGLFFSWYYYCCTFLCLTCVPSYNDLYYTTQLELFWRSAGLMVTNFYMKSYLEKKMVGGAAQLQHAILASKLFSHLGFIN